MGILKKIIKNVFKSGSESEQSLDQLSDSLKDADLDYKFAQLFTHSGGFFNYCSNESEALQTLYKILKTEQISSVFCFDKDLQNFLNVTQTPFTDIIENHTDAAFITCEFLIAHDAKVVLSYENIKHYPTFDLPNIIIIMATVSQIVSNLSDAMFQLKKRGNVKNLTSISGVKSDLENLHREKLKLYLLLIED